MGQFISTNSIASTHKVNNIDLRFEITSPIQQNATGKNVDVVISGCLYKDQKKVEKITDKMIEDFKNFVKTDRFKTYVNERLFDRNTQIPDGYPYTIPDATLESLSWQMVSDPVLERRPDAFDLHISFKLTDDKGRRNTLRSAVVFMAKSIVQALEEKRSEAMPVKDADGKDLEFGPDYIRFSIAQ